jgi:molybdenum cofactor biosynthesis enzyme MoaA
MNLNKFSNMANFFEPPKDPKEIEIALTFKCNWNCDFCCEDTHNRVNITFDDIKNKLKILDKFPGKGVILSGGEIGTLPTNILEYVFDKIKDRHVSINTNGLFLKKYKQFKPFVNTIGYHCSEDLTTDPDYETLEYWDTQEKDFMIVVNETNLKNLENFLERNKNQDFTLDLATQYPGGKTKIFRKKDRFKLLKIIHKYDNVKNKKEIFASTDLKGGAHEVYYV